MSAAPLLEQLRTAAGVLAAAEVPSPRHDAEVLAAHVLGVERGALLTQPDPDDSFAPRFDELVRRRAGREPLQHLTGEAPFRHLILQVGPGCSSRGRRPS